MTDLSESLHLYANPQGLSRCVGEISAFDPRKHAGDVAQAPMLGDLAGRHAEDVTEGKSQAFSGRRCAEQQALLRASIDEARRRWKVTLAEVRFGT